MANVPHSTRATWRTLWWGSEDAPLARKLSIVGLVAFMALALAGLFVDFVPAEGLYGTAAAAIFFFVGLVLSLLLFLRVSGTGRTDNLFRQGRLKAVACIAVMPVFIGYMLWLGFVKALPWAATRALGSDHATQARMRTDHESSRRSCDYRIEGGPLDRTLPGFLCISQQYYRAHQDAEVIVRLHGKRSALGFAIVSVEHLSDASE